ncbi:MAG: hypothetical protein R3F39_16615 [Myxococcota bacterium]
MARAGPVVVPSEDGPGLPREGSPHIIAQAVAAGVLVLAGPNAAAREAVRRLDQAELSEAGLAALAAATIAACTRKPRQTCRSGASAWVELTWGPGDPAAGRD